MKRSLPIVIILAGSLIGFYRSQNPCVLGVDQTLQNGWQGGFQVKIERMPECSSWFRPRGVRFVVSVKPANSDEWRKTNTTYSPRTVDIPADAIVVESERVAVVSLMDMKLTLVDGQAVNIDFGTTK